MENIMICKESGCPAKGREHAYLRKAAILTSLAFAPMADAFRPPYSGEEKPLYTFSQMKPIATLPALEAPNPAQVPNIQLI